MNLFLETANDGIQDNPSLQCAFIDNVLLEHSHIHLFTYWLQLLSLVVEAETIGTTKPKIFALWPYSEKVVDHSNSLTFPYVIPILLFSSSSGVFFRYCNFLVLKFIFDPFKNIFCLLRCCFFIHYRHNFLYLVEHSYSSYNYI